MRKALIWMAAGLVAMQVAPAAAESFGDALASAYKNSDLLAQNQAVLRAADEDVAVAVAALRPVVSWLNQATWSNGESVSLFGGKGSILNAVIGTLLLAGLSNLMNILLISPHLQDAVGGLIIVAAIMLNVRLDPE